MKKFIPNEEAVIEAKLRADDRERDLKWVRERLAQAENKLDRAEQEWQRSGGYGSRSQMTRLDNVVRLCRLALRGLETGCHRPAYQRHRGLKKSKEESHKQHRPGNPPTLS